jgi:hypothetical protein
LTDETMQALSNAVAAKITEQMAERLQAVETSAAKVLEDLTAQFTALSERIAKLEAPLEETVKQVIKDMPRNQTTKLVYRPTQRAQTQAEQPEVISSSELAAETLAKIKAKGA